MNGSGAVRRVKSRQSRDEFHFPLLIWHFPFVILCVAAVRVISWIVFFLSPGHDPRNHTKQREINPMSNDKWKVA
jgi:hypothetical protein